MSLSSTNIGRARVGLAPATLAIALALLAGCSTSEEDAPAVAPALAPADPGVTVTFEGRVTYDFVPAVYDPVKKSGTLAFASATAKPVRNAVVRVRSGTTVLATGSTDEDGRYALTFAAGDAATVSLEALARTTAPSIQVEDNTDANAVWAVGVATEASSGERNLHATHGWTGTTYDPARRIAAPFAILDSMYTAARGFLDIPRAVPFPPLKVNWSPKNTTTWGDKTKGEIGTSHYASGEGEIYILGKAGLDTDEFDAHVIVHEWGHFFEARLSRSDSPGGPHGPGDVLDPRLAFGEGYGTALAAMLLPEPIYADTYWARTSIRAFGFSAETPYSDDPRPGPFSELSVLRLLYDLWDGGAGEAFDTVALGLGPIYDVLVGPQKTTPALTTVASFVAALKAHPDATALAADIDALLAQHSIGPISDAWGTGDADLRAIYLDVEAIPYAKTVTLEGGPYSENKRQAVQYFVVTGTGKNVTVTASAPSDVGLVVYRTGQPVAWADSYLGGATERTTFGTVAGTIYVVVLTGYEQATGSYDVSVTVNGP